MKKGFGGAHGLVPQTDKAALGFDSGAGKVGSNYERPVATGAGGVGSVRARFDQQAAAADTEKRRIDEARAARAEADRLQQVRGRGGRQARRPRCFGVGGFFF
jgi:hypothetical protein